MRLLLSLLGIAVVTGGCTAQNWINATGDRIVPYRIEGLLIDRSVSPPARQIVVRYRIPQSVGASWYAAIPVTADLKPEPTYAANVDFSGRPIVSNEQYKRVAATPFNVESSSAIAAKMKSGEFLPLGAAGGIEIVRSFGAMECNGTYWSRYWLTSAPPKSSQESIDFGYALLLPPSYPRPRGEHAASIGLTAAATPVTLVGDAILAPIALIAWQNPQLWDAVSKADEDFHNALPKSMRD